MGSITQPSQVNLEQELKERDKRFGIDHEEKARKRAAIAGPEIHENADGWWKESRTQ